MRDARSRQHLTRSAALSLRRGRSVASSLGHGSDKRCAALRVLLTANRFLKSESLSPQSCRAIGELHL
jgi:hypothetical protein